VTAAAGGAPARRLMETLDFDLAVFDVMMPGEDGFSLTKWLREQRGPAGRTPVLMLTAMGETSDRIEGLKSGRTTTWASPSSRRSCSCASRRSCAGPRTGRRRAGRCRSAIAASIRTVAN